MYKIFFLSCAWLLSLPLVSPGQETVITLALDQVIETARRQSPEVLSARHAFRSSYWNYCYYRANYLPSLIFGSTPRFNHAINAITLPDGTQQYVSQNQLTTDATLSLSQNVPFTGGSLSVQTSIQRLDMFGNRAYSYKSTPVVVTYSQSLFGHNAPRWDRRIEPLRFEEARRNYVETLELVATRAVAYFFALARAQADLEIARVNHANADTLHLFARGRYEIGTITENEMLQLEINKLTEESNRLNARLTVDDCMGELRAYLGIDDPRPIVVTVQGTIPLISVDAAEALQHASSRGTDVLYRERRRLESESNVASARANAGLRADLYVQFGLAQTGRDLETAYKNPLNQQHVEVGIRLPLLDWGRGRGQVQVARSTRDLVHAQMEQQGVTLELNVIKTVKQFNLQANQLEVAARADETARRRSDVARKLYLLGKANILDLNASIADKDAARRNYINTLANYWSLYYMLRSITLFDFEQGIPITEDFRLLMN